MAKAKDTFKDQLDNALEDMEMAQHDYSYAEEEGIKGSRLDDYDRKFRDARAKYRSLRQRLGMAPYQVGGHEQAKDAKATDSAKRQRLHRALDAVMDAAKK